MQPMRINLRLFLDNQSLEFEEIWNENALGNK